MASSSRPVSDEELQKAMDDLKELIARNPIPDEFKVLLLDEDKKEPEKKKKKRLYRLAPDEVQMMLNYQCEEPQECKAINALAEEDHQKYGDMKTGVSVSQVFTRRCNDNIRAAQEMMRYELRTKGYVTFEATDDEAEDEDAAAPQQGAQGGRGRRRHRPGITKRAGGEIKKLN